MSKIICIDPGHCDKFPGAHGSNQFEENDNVRLALLVEKHLTSFGHTVYLTHRDGGCVDARNSDADLNARPLFANKVNADYFISLHRNSFSGNATGIEGWIYSKADANTEHIAACVLQECLSVASVSNRGLKRGYTGQPNADYAVNRMSKMPSMLLELLFVSNDNDNAIYNANIDAYARAIAVGICKGLNANYNPPAAPVPAPAAPVSNSQSDKLYRVQVGAYRDKAGADKLLEELKSKGYSGFVV